MSFITDFQRAGKREDARGRCLHFSDDAQCNEIVSAHSIQKSGQLQSISEEGHVYRLNADVSTLSRNEGKIGVAKSGIAKASTFSGFCKHHDNKLFKPIDSGPLVWQMRQIALYAYRSMCRELFVKKNAASVLERTKNHPSLSREDAKLLASMHAGQLLGLARLEHQKKYYDDALASKGVLPFEYFAFETTSKWSLQCSGLLFPEFDFGGGILQDLSDLNQPLDLITFFTAPTANGWAFAFAWHAVSSPTCIPFIQSLHSQARIGGRIEDILLRLTFSCCENHAIRMSWWDNLLRSDQSQIIERVSLMVDPNAAIPSDYLSEGLNGIANWEFENIRTSLIVDA